MNKENAAQYLPLVQALAEGKTIQVASRDKTVWIDMAEDIVWSDNPDYYRIKPGPREFYMWRDSPHDAWTVREHPPEFNYLEVIRVREILD